MLKVCSYLGLECEYFLFLPLGLLFQVLEAALTFLAGLSRLVELHLRTFFHKKKIKLKSQNYN